MVLTESEALASCRGKNGIGSKWVCWLVQAVGTALMGLSLQGALHSPGVDCLAPVSELSVKYKSLSWEGAIPPQGRAVALGKKGKRHFATVRSSPRAGLFPAAAV